MTRPLYHDYSAIEADLPLLLEAAWVALRDAELFDLVAEETDTSDDELAAVRDRLHRFIAVGFPAGSTGSPLARALAAVPGYSEEPNDAFEEKDDPDDFYRNKAGVSAWYFALHVGDNEDAASLAAEMAYQEG